MCCDAAALQLSNRACSLYVDIQYQTGAFRTSHLAALVVDFTSSLLLH